MINSKEKRSFLLTGESVVLEDDLMDDSGSGLPEADSVLGSGRGEEVVDLLVHVLGPGQILLALDLGLDQVIAVDRGGHGDLGQPGGDELEHGHLRGGVLHGDAVGPEAEVALAPHDVLVGGVVQVGVEDLLGEGEGAVEPGLDRLEVGDEALVGEGGVLVELGHGHGGNAGGVEGRPGGGQGGGWRRAEAESLKDGFVTRQSFTSVLSFCLKNVMSGNRIDKRYKTSL